MAKYKSILSSFRKIKDRFVVASLNEEQKETIRRNLKSRFEGFYSEIFQIVNKEQFGEPELDLDFDFKIVGKQIEIVIKFAVVVAGTKDPHRLYKWLDEGTSDTVFTKNSPYFDIRKPDRTSSGTFNIKPAGEVQATTWIRAGQTRKGMKARNFTQVVQDEINSDLQQNGIAGLTNITVSIIK